MYCLTHKTGEIRLLHKKDGSYILQEEWINENAISKEGKYKKWWEDKKNIEENYLVEDTTEYMTIEEYTHQGQKKVIDFIDGNVSSYHWENV